MKQLFKNKNITTFFVVVLILVLALTISHVFTGNVIIKTSTDSIYYSVDEDINFTYNIKINNTDLLFISNITKVNISLPSSFSFLSESNGTDSPLSSFSRVNNDLIWNNDGLVMNLSTQSFWFNSSASTPGNYNLTITTTNFTGIYLFYIPITINDLTIPQLIEFVSPTELNSTSVVIPNILVNVTAEDNVGIDTIIIRLFNSTNEEIASKLSTSSSFFVNFTGLMNGIYYFNSTVNDSSGNINSTETRTITVSLLQDIIAPIITLIDPVNLVFIVADQYNFTFSVTDSSVVNNCTLIFDGNIIDTLSMVNNASEINTLHGSSFSLLNHDWNIKCVDSSGNIGESQVRTLIVGSENTNTTAVSATTTTQIAETTNIIDIKNDILIDASKSVNSDNSPSKEDLIKGYEKIINKKENLTFDIKNESHSLNVKNISEKNVKIILSSTPQEATFLLGEEKKFDLSEDGYYDLSVKLNFIYYVNESDPKANFTIKTIYEKIETVEPVSGKIKPEDIEKDNGLIILIIFASIIVILIFIALISKIFKLYKNSKKIKVKIKKNK